MNEDSQDTARRAAEEFIKGSTYASLFNIYPDTNVIGLKSGTLLAANMKAVLQGDS